MIRMEKKDGAIEIVAPYNETFIEKIKWIHGSWNGKAWVVDEDMEKYLDDIFKEAYGFTPAEQNDRIEVTYDAGDFEEGNVIQIGGIRAARRESRDSFVRVYKDSIVKSGKFPSKGGSIKNPRVEGYGVTMVTIIPKALYESLSDSDKSKLRVED